MFSFGQNEERRETLKQEFPMGYDKLKKNERRNFGTHVITIPDDPEEEQEIITDTRNFFEKSKEMA